MSLSHDTHIVNLKVEYRNNPIGIDSENPRFSWNMLSNERGQHQTAYQILIATRRELLSPETVDVWNSGRMISDKSVAIKYGGKTLSPSTRYYWKTIIWDQNNVPIHSTSDNYFETGLRSNDGITGWDGAKWISMDNRKRNSTGAPMFRKVTKLSGTVKTATLYISSLGAFKVNINGKSLGVMDQEGNLAHELLTPGWSNYDTTINYMTYDVSSYIKNDSHVAIGAIIGNGWFNSRISSGSQYYSEEGNDLALFAKLLITFHDDSTQVIVTDTSSGWKSTDTGPFRENDIYDGETYDATKEIKNWDMESFDDSNWNPVKEHHFIKLFPNVKVTSYNGIPARIMDELDQHPQNITLFNGIINKEKSENRKGEIKVIENRKITDISELPLPINSGETAIYDLGQNMVGVPRIIVKGKAGTQIKLRFGEMLNDDSEGADGPKGSVYYANLRTAKQTCHYTLKGNENGEVYQCSMTFFGFRYVEITVLTKDSTIEVLELRGKVASSLTKQSGRIETSNKDINKLFNNIIWGHRGNYFWIPTDCPQRDERLGWTGDTQLFANTALYNGECNLFLENFMDMLVDSQGTYGFDHASFTSTAPGYKCSNFNSFAFEGKGPKGQSGWADAGVILPWTVWQMTGDTTIIEENYDSMVKYMNWIYSLTGEKYKGPGSIGDWLGFQGTGNQLMSDAYYAYDALLMSSMAKAINKEEDVKKFKALFQDIKDAFIERYICQDHSGNILVKSSIIEDENDIFEDGISVYRSIKEDNTQSTLLWCLKLGLYKDGHQRQQLIDLLANNIKNTSKFKASHPDSTRTQYAENTLSTGFLGVNIIAPVLTDFGLSELAYGLLLQDGMPSWLYSVKNGATTIWERWNSYSIENGFGDVGMNSFNHYAYGAIAEWMYKYMAGISNDPNDPGFKHIILRPTIDEQKRITKVKGTYESAYGTITSNWELENDTFTYQVMIPANTTATICIPAISESDIYVDDKIKPVKYTNGTAEYEVVSGSYKFKSKIPKFEEFSLKTTRSI
ncbi:family 78 glycoside hydrolase catalytic domain [Mesobacillus foraminis]|uniref:family 78 glycoside hydrolase catalytic domain n=1 Tax=Mesobacillus foraminis TaxID=279826 RepID=UPI001BE99F60|nr:alpha-L-rhamnosidase [Mesobacillus foraminis]MBT2757823.1 family 78 glycoside hydrolase catalytic domain [Mesobacillus foraminis]